MRGPATIDEGWLHPIMLQLYFPVLLFILRRRRLRPDSADGWFASVPESSGPRETVTLRMLASRLSKTRG